MVPRMVGQALDRVVTNGRCRIEIGRDRHLVPILNNARGREIVVVSSRHVERPLESLRPRVAVDMPLPGVIAPVARWLEQLRQEPRPVGTLLLAAATPFRQRIAADRLRVGAGEDRTAGRPAASGVIALCEPQAASREAVEVGRVDLAAVTAKIGIAEIIGQDHDHVGRRRHGGHTTGHGQCDREEPREHTMRTYEWSHGTALTWGVNHRISASRACTVAA